MLISIFNGRTRGLGRAEQSEVYVRVSVALREHLHLLKGARLGVFLAIALHSDEHGRARPSIDLLRKETGYNKETISKALTDLCQIEIDGSRILLAIQEREDGGSFATNEYLIFPDPDEIAHHEAAGTVRKARATVEPSTEKPDTVEPSTEKPCPVKPSTENMYGSITTSKKNHGGGGGGSRPREKPKHVRYLLGQGMGAAEGFADLDPDTAIADFDNRIAAGQTIAMIVRAWRASPPEKGNPYVRRETAPDAGPAPRRARPGTTAGPAEPGVFTTKLKW